MSFITNQIASYQLIARIGTPAQGSRTNRYDIVLQGERGDTLGVVNFWKPDELQNSYMGSNGYPEVHLEEFHFTNILDVLRNEGPLYFKYNPNPGNGAPLQARIITEAEEASVGDEG